MIKTSDSMGRPRNMTQPFNVRDEMGVTISAAQAWILDLGYGGWSKTQCRGSEWSVVTIIVQSLCSHIKITLYGYSLLQCNALIVQNCGNSSGPKTGNVAISSLGHMVICPDAWTRPESVVSAQWAKQAFWAHEFSQKYLEGSYKNI